MSMINRRGAAKALGAAVLGGASAVAAAPSANARIVDPIVGLWAQAQILNAEWERVSKEQNNLRNRIIRRNPLQPQGTIFAHWYRDDPDITRCGALREQSNELGYQTCDLYDKIEVTVAVTPEGIRAKAAAALSLLVQEKRLAEEIWYYDLICNALREAAAGSAGA